MEIRRRIFYFCYDHNRPSGGQKHTYQHVDILNEAGLDAVVVHAKPGTRLTWFENRTRVTTLPEAMAEFNAARDVWVLPEDLGQHIHKFSGAKVIFDKNLYHGFAALGNPGPIQYPQLSAEVAAILAVSDHNVRHLRFAYPRANVIRVYSSIRGDLFRFRPWAEKKPRVLTIGKAVPQLLAIYHTLMARSAAGLSRANQFEWTMLTNSTEAETAGLMGEAVAVVFTSIEEGLPRFVIEALASGCVAVALSSGPLVELLRSGPRFHPGDAISAVEFLEKLCADFPERPEPYLDQIAAGRKVAAEFTRERQIQSVLEAWHRIDRLLEEREDPRAQLDMEWQQCQGEHLQEVTTI